MASSGGHDLANIFTANPSGFNRGGYTIGGRGNQGGSFTGGQFTAPRFTGDLTDPNAVGQQIERAYQNRVLNSVSYGARGVPTTPAMERGFTGGQGPLDWMFTSDPATRLPSGWTNLGTRGTTTTFRSPLSSSPGGGVGGTGMTPAQISAVVFSPNGPLWQPGGGGRR